MCSICNKLGQVFTEEARSKLLVEIYEAVALGQPQEHFKAILDKLLDTQLEERDLDIECLWSGTYEANR